jgi:putative ABC transport system substrate-binding protein
MRNRSMLAVVVFVVSLLSLMSSADAQSAKVPRIGYLSGGAAPAGSGSPTLQAFRQGLRELGFVEGANLVIEYRYAEGKVDRLPGLAAELVALPVDLIAVDSTPAALAAKSATTLISIVFAGLADPVGRGVVSNLERPGGNITGFMQADVSSKRLEVFKDAVPGVSRVGVLSTLAQPDLVAAFRIVEAAGRLLGLETHLVEARDPGELDAAFSAMASRGITAVTALPIPMFFSERRRIVELAIKNRLPTFFHLREYVEAGALLSYGVNLPDLSRRAATYVDRILKGVKPADLPVEQPTKFELVINLKTAKALGLTIPPAVLARADEVIQ